VRSIVWGLLVISVLAVPVHLAKWGRGAPVPPELWPNVVMMALAPILLRALRRGKSWEVSLFLLCKMFLLFAAVNVLRADPASPNHVIYIGISLTAAVLVGERGAIGFSAAGLVALLVTTVLGASGLRGTQATSISFIQAAFTHAVVLAFSTFLIVLATRSRRRAIERARQYAAQLEERSQELQVMLDSFPDLLLRVSTDGTVLDCKAGTEPSLHLVPAELLGQRLQDVLPEDARERTREALQRLFLFRRVQAMDYLVPSPRGTQAFEVRLAPFRADQAIVMVRDITPRWEAQEETRRLNAELERRVAERTAALEATNRELEKHTVALERSNADLEHFAYVASHDLQEPLRMVSSYAQLLSRRYKGKLDASADEFIHFVVDGAQRMSGLIRALLEYSRVGRGAKLEPTDSEALLAAAVENLQVAIQEAGAEVTHDALPKVDGDAVLLTQVFQNLVANGLKFRRSDLPPRVHVSALRASAGVAGRDEWRFSVRDNGIGIAPESVGKLFFLFQRLHGRDEYPGTGIGLATCKKIVERQGGRIWVESKPGEGSTFFFALPASRAA